MTPEQQPQTGRRQIVVTVREDYQEQMPQVCEALAQHGVQIEQVLTDLGMITGSVADAEHATAAAQVDGVASLDEQMHHRVPPPESPVQ